jgi:hypothetical protein
MAGSGGRTAPLAEVLRIAGRLPLTDAEKAEAFCRLLADQGAKGKP